MAIPALVAIAVVSCSSGSSDDSSDGSTTTEGSTSSGASSTTATSAPIDIFVSVPAPPGVTYVGEQSVGGTGYWATYQADEVTEDDLTTYADTLKVDGWTAEGVSADGFAATTEGAWLDVVVTDDGPTTLAVCVWDAEPAADQCAQVGPSLEGTAAITTTTPAPSTTAGG